MTKRTKKSSAKKATAKPAADTFTVTEPAPKPEPEPVVESRQDLRGGTPATCRHDFQPTVPRGIAQQCLYCGIFR